MGLGLDLDTEESTNQSSPEVETDESKGHVIPTKQPKIDMSGKIIYEDEMKRALEEDGQRTSLYISPQSYFPNVS